MKPVCPVGVFLESRSASITFVVHLEDRDLVCEPVDCCERDGRIGKTGPHFPNGWLAVIRIDLCSHLAEISAKAMLVSARSLTLER
jgi:hypothetical protein